MLTVGGLFSGIGGWELGLERAGMRVLWHCESDPYARRVLERHWPAVPCYPDVRDLRGTDLEPVDVLAGGFPCQDISVAGRGAGIAGERSGLWAEMFRLTAELRPRYLLVENVAALIVRGLDVVLADLASIGFDAEWDCLRASDFGAPHRRERIWLIAYPRSDELRMEPRGLGGPHGADTPVAGGNGASRAVAYSGGERRNGRPGGEGAGRDAPLWVQAGDHAGDRGRASVADADREPVGWLAVAWAQCDQWLVEPDVGRVANGVPARVDRLRCLGNALVPQISEWIGHRVIEDANAS